MRKLLQQCREIYAFFYAGLRRYLQEAELAAKLQSIASAIGFLTVLVLVGIGLWVLVVVPQWQVNRTLDLNHELGLAKQLELEDAFRKTDTQIVLGGFGLFLLFFTWRRARAGDKTVRIMEQGHITDRFTKAIEQLGKMENDKPNIEVRLGAIYALERIALDSPRDHWTIMEILTAYVRQNAPLDPNRPFTKDEKPRTDIQAILTVLGRRRTGSKRERPGQWMDLTESRLCGANLNEANLQNAILRGANLQQANLYEANLQNAMLWEANMQKTNLNKANLQQARLWRANLHQADFWDANLQKTELWEANLQKADLRNADLQEATFWNANLQEADLSEANLRKAELWETNMQKAFLNKANLQEAMLKGTSLQKAGGLTVNQIKSARDWQDAHYSPDFRAELGLPPEDPTPAPQQ